MVLLKGSSDRLHTMTEIKLYRSPWKVIRLLAPNSVMLWGSVLMLMDHRWLAGSLGIVFCGSINVLFFYYLFDRRPQIIINQHGIFDRTLHEQFINWELIEDAYLVGTGAGKMISLVVDDTFKPSNKKARWLRLIIRLNEAMGYQELRLKVGFLNVDAAQLVELILLMRTATKPDGNS